MTTPLDQTRADFEAFWTKRHHPVPMNTRMRDDGRYGCNLINAEWEAWQAAIASRDARIAELEAALSIGFSHMMLAPIDGTPVLLYMPTTDEKFAVGQWHGSPDSIIGNWGDDEGNYYVHQPVGWIRIGALEKLAVASNLPQDPPTAAEAAKEQK